MAQAEQHSPKRRDARVVEWTALEMRHTGDCIQGSNPCLSAQASAAVGSIQPAALLFSKHLSISPNPPTGKPRPAAPSSTVPSPRHFHCDNPHLPRHWFSQENAQNSARKCAEPHKRGTEPRSRRHRTVQENPKDPCNKTHSPAQQKALTRMKKDTDRTFPKGRGSSRKPKAWMERKPPRSTALPWDGKCSTLRWPTERAASVTAARCIRHRTALRFWWHSSGKQGEATWTGATRAVRRPPFCLQSIGTPYSACRNRRISAKSINFVQLWKSRQGNTMRAVQ